MMSTLTPSSPTSRRPATAFLGRGRKPRDSALTRAVRETAIVRDTRDRIRGEIPTPDRRSGLITGGSFVIVVLAWAFIHHLLAGIRHLLMDAHVGVELSGARRSAALTLVLSVVLTIAIAVRLW